LEARVRKLKSIAERQIEEVTNMGQGLYLMVEILLSLQLRPTAVDLNARQEFYHFMLDQARSLGSCYHPISSIASTSAVFGS
jgi:methyltransferase-like protein